MPFLIAYCVSVRLCVCVYIFFIAFLSQWWIFEYICMWTLCMMPYAYVCHPSSTSSSPPPSSSPSLLAVDFLFNDLQISHCISRVVCCWTIWATASRKTLLHEVVQCTYKFKLHILIFLSTSFCRYRSHTRRCAVFEFLQHHSSSHSHSEKWSEYKYVPKSAMVRQKYILNESHNIFSIKRRKTP